MKSLISIVFLSLGPAALLACTEEPNSTTSSGDLHVLAQVGEGDATATYLAPTGDFASGSLTFLGNGTELGDVYEAVAVGGHIYAQDFSSTELVKLTPNGSGGYTRDSALLITSVTAGGYFRTLKVIDDATVLCMTWPDPAGNVDYAFVDLTDFSFADSGSFVMQPLEDEDYVPTELGSPVVVGDKVYVGTMYTYLDTYDFSPDLHTLVLDYPSFANPVRFSSDLSVGTTGGFVTQSMFEDESGYVYQHNIRSKFWYNMGTAEDQDTYVLRIAPGERAYDESYAFNISEQFDEEVSLIQLTYVGDGIAFGAMLWEDRATDWEEAYAQNRGFIAKFDLEAQTVTAMDLPDSPVLTTSGPLVENGTFYMPLAPRGEQARIYALDPTGGSDAFTEGLELDGNNIEIRGLYRTTP
ncbi:MAG: DUF4374 domain-containing protein [Myxococcota bacterium]